MAPDDDALRRRVAELERRVERLEAAPGPGTGGASTGRSAGGAALQVLDRLRDRADAGSGSGATGAVAYAGAAGFDGREYLWAQEHNVGDLVGADQAAGAAVLECLGSPARLALVAALMGVPRNRTQLQEVLGETSTGHLYHHLRALQAAGLLVQRRRGEYELVAQAVVPLLTILAAAQDLGAGGEPTRAEVAE